MAELFLLAILICSFLGMAIILLRKIPVLVKLPEIYPPKESAVSKIKKCVKNLPGAQRFNYELYLQKILSKIRVLTLKTESKTGSWLEKLRRKAIQKNNHNSDHYWQELKKSKGGK